MIRISLVLALIALVFPPMARAQEAPPLVTAPEPAATLPPAPSMRTPAAPAPVVLELFTSQGCAFCPPADELMGQMIKQPGIIGLACHVDYFSVRKNNLGKGFCTKRQNDYQRLIGRGPRYTPQLIVNGRADMIGYEGGKISAAILKARAQKLSPITLTKSDSMEQGVYNVSFPALALNGARAKLWLAVYDSPKRLAVTEGRNLGKTVTYYNVVSRLDDLGEWDGAAMVRGVNAYYAPENGGIAILAQDQQTGNIIAAGQALR
ncbi:MAG: DUF1223 domain-containing protein [Micavibrio sp.]